MLIEFASFLEFFFLHMKTEQETVKHENVDLYALLNV